MKLIEADGKNILQAAGVLIPQSCSAEDVKNFPVFIKAQLLQGRRGQRGLVRRCLNREELEKAQSEMSLALQDVPYGGFICESEIIFKTQWFLALDIDRTSGAVRLSFSENGGMNVDSAESRQIFSVNDITESGLPTEITAVVVRLYEAFIKNDVLHLEINPLVCLDDGSCVALDAKVELDDAAAFRHPEWSALTLLNESARLISEREKAYSDFLTTGGYRGTLGRFVELDGDIAMILSGGGASLVAIDALKLAGGRPANYVEMSGNPDPEQVKKASKIVLSKPGIKAIWIAGSFANFTDIQATVTAVLAAVDELGLRVPIVVRRDGPNAASAQEEVARWAIAQGIGVRFDRAGIDLDDSAKAVVEASRL